MAQKKVYSGSLGPFLFNDSSSFSDGVAMKGLVSETGIVVSTTTDPTGDELVNETYLNKVIRRVTVISITDPSAELNLLDAEHGGIVVCSQVVAGDNLTSIYIGDTSSTAIESVPDTVNGVGSTMWLKFSPDSAKDWETASVGTIHPTNYVDNNTNTYAYIVSGVLYAANWDTNTPTTSSSSIVCRPLSGSTTWNQTNWYSTILADGRFGSIYTQPYLQQGHPPTMSSKDYEIISMSVQVAVDTSSHTPTTGDPIFRIYVFIANNQDSFALGLDYSTMDTNTLDIVDIGFPNPTLNNYNKTVEFTDTNFPNTKSLASGAQNPTWGIGVAIAHGATVPSTSATTTFRPSFTITLNYKEV